MKLIDKIVDWFNPKPAPPTTVTLYDRNGRGLRFPLGVASCNPESITWHSLDNEYSFQIPANPTAAMLDELAASIPVANWVTP